METPCDGASTCGARVRDLETGEEHAFDLHPDALGCSSRLDHLAQMFVASGMSIKALHREIMLSATYQLSADHDPAAFAKDGERDV